MKTDDPKEPETQLDLPEDNTNNSNQDEHMFIWKKEKKIRQYRSNQGRSPERQSKIYKGCFWSLLIFLVVSLTCAVSNVILGWKITYI